MIRIPADGDYGRSANPAGLTIDWSAHERDKMPAGPITLERFADTAATLASEVGLDRVVFIGHSMGGPIASRQRRRPCSWRTRVT
jgi:pimeloyl-ACP methyl ester carboxylesterase